MYKIFKIQQFGMTTYELRQSGTFGTTVLAAGLDIEKLRILRDTLNQSQKIETEVE